MKVNIITLTIALLITENSAVYLKNYIKEDLIDANNDIHVSTLKLKTGKVEPVAHISPKAGTGNKDP